jgi:hypothetical protein
LTKFVNGEVEMQPAQVTAALGLLKKSLPDLANVQLSGDKDNPIPVMFQTVYERTSGN